MIHRISIVSLSAGLLFLLVVIAFGFGCTYAQKGDARYLSVLQRKAASITYNPTTGAFVVNYNTDSDPAVELFEAGVTAGLALAGKAAAGAVAP